MNWKVAFFIMCLVAFLSLVYAYVQTTIAKGTMQEAMAQRELADQQRTMAEQSRVEAEQQRLEAEKQRELYMNTLKELEELKKKRK